MYGMEMNDARSPSLTLASAYRICSTSPFSALLSPRTRAHTRAHARAHTHTPTRNHHTATSTAHYRQSLDDAADLEDIIETFQKQIDEFGEWRERDAVQTDRCLCLVGVSIELSFQKAPNIVRS